MNSRVLVVCGEPGVGKSYIAGFLSRRTGARILRTDEIRKELFGPDPEYTTEESQATYDEMFSRAENALDNGVSVILDATFMLQSGRERAREIATEKDATLDVLRVVCDPETAKRRILGRDGVPDSDEEIHDSIADRFEPVKITHHEIDNSGSWEETVGQIESKVLSE
jgi:predicted kinase